MKKILISSYDMDVGGVERSLINLLENFDYDNYEVDLMLYRHYGDFMKFIPSKPKLLNEIDGYNTFGVPIYDLVKDRKYLLALVRVLSKLLAGWIKYKKNINEIAYYQAQLMRRLSLPFLPRIEKEYDAAISYVWPHYFISQKVKAKKKVAWIHTDYSTIYTSVSMDLKMWSKFDHIVSISEDCTNAFLKKYPQLKNKIVLIENITSPDFIKKMSGEHTNDDIENANGFNILTVGRISYAKGIDIAVNALKMLHDKGLNRIRWYVIGCGPEESAIRDLIANLELKNDFILLGKKTNPYPYIKNCDLYVQPSRYEGKAVSITEALILEKPILLTNYTTAKSQITNNIDGIITELSVRGIAEGIEKLIKDDKLRIKLAENTCNKDYSNAYELEKLYKLIN